MNCKVKRIFVEKKAPFDVEARALWNDIRQNLSIASLDYIRIINRYDISGLSVSELDKAKYTIFSEKTVDNLFEDNISLVQDEYGFAVEYLPGQYDQRADSAAQCSQLLMGGSSPNVKSSRVIILGGQFDEEDIKKIKAYVINPVDSREASMEPPEKSIEAIETPEDVSTLDMFINFNIDLISKLHKELNLAMSLEDLIFCQRYFQEEEKRDPTLTEIKVIDTYWSDHCRHTTFLTEIEEVAFEEGKYSDVIKEAFEKYKESRNYIYGNNHKPISLMDIATLGMKELRKRGLLEDIDLSEEINACSIKVHPLIDGKKEDWIVMFKNETHNHPTEIEPFGGAATCLGGAIRDPLSGRTYVYQAMRLTGSGDPRAKIQDTLPGKLPQRKITSGAAHGYSSYGNQIGIATGFVEEVYNEGFKAKRMEIGAVIGAAPLENIRRSMPLEGDKIILVGGRTGRDGCGGATGSSKQHTVESLLNCGAEVQKGNAPTERKIQRLFRKSEATTLIKRCNDFGAGGVSVAIGELAEGLTIDLDLIPKKYEGLDGTELAISESQERMAVVVAAEDAEKFIGLAHEENLEATIVAEVTSEERLIMKWKGKKIVDISRQFLNTNGAKSYSRVLVQNPQQELNFFNSPMNVENIKDTWLRTLQNLNICSRKGLVERFDSTIGTASILMPFGGLCQLTPSEGMAAKLPVLEGNTSTATLMTCGYNPEIGIWSPFHGALYAVIESAAKIVALGGDYKRVRLTLQEYFEKLGEDDRKWGKPFSALLGAFYAQKMLNIPAIGGKDSMSGSFNELNVPPTLASFAVSVVDDCSKIISQEFKRAGSKVVVLLADRDDKELPDFDKLKKNFEKIHELIHQGKVLSSFTVKSGGICEAVSKMCFGNKIGFKFSEEINSNSLFNRDYGSVVLELTEDMAIESQFEGLNYAYLGSTDSQPFIWVDNLVLDLEELINLWQKPLEEVFPSKTKEGSSNWEKHVFSEKDTIFKHSVMINLPKPKVFIPVFPGTNCEYDSVRAFEKAGAKVSTFVFRNMNPEDIEESVSRLKKEISTSQILMLPGGFSAGDEPEGSGKFIATVFRNPNIAEETMKLLKHRDGLILGICNGFQALIKLGLLPYGEIRDIDNDSPTLTYNSIGRHVSTMVNTKIVSKLSPWFNEVSLGDIHTVPVSHGEGRFVGKEEVIKNLFIGGQVATQYVDQDGLPSINMPYNPNGSYYAVEGITSPDGKVLGKMAHSERVGSDIHRNIVGNKDQRIFKSGINYFK
jgi:phosphoribosylformylglycinamidine synthase